MTDKQLQNSVSSKDVARAAGVSRTMVSYVLNNKTEIKIKNSTRQKVLETAQRLGYRINSNARALKTNRSMCLGVMCRWNLVNERFSRLLESLRKQASKYGYNLIICSDDADGGDLPNYLQMYYSNRVDGIILISSSEDIPKKVVNHIYNNKIPCIFIDYHFKKKGLVCLDFDDYQAGYDTIDYLFSKGHRRVKYIHVGPDITLADEARYKGVQEVSKKYPGDLMKVDSACVTGNEESRIKAIADELANLGECTAVVANRYSLAYRILAQAHKLELRIPEDVAIVSLGSTSFSPFTHPPLTALEMPLDDMGVQAIDAIANLIQNKELKKYAKLKYELVVRESA